MELSCQHCHQQIPEYDYDWKRLAAKCNQCGTWTAFRSTTSVQQPPEMLELELSNYVFPDYTDPSYIDFAYSLEFSRNEDAVMIVQSPENKSMTNFVYVMSIVSGCFIFSGLLVLLTVAFEQNFNALVLPASLAAVCTGILAALSPLNYFLNSNVIMVDRENIYLSARPYPFLNGVGASEKITGYKQFYVTRKSGSKKGFGLFGIDFDNKRKEIIVGDEKFVLLLESEIEKFLNIKDRPVGGALSNPYQTEDE